MLSVDHVGPNLLEAGSELRIEGEGFPLGRTAEVLLSGELKRPGLPALAINLTMAGETRAAGEIAILFDDELIERLGGRGTFRGVVRVSFPGASGLRIYGRREASFDLLPGRAEGFATGATTKTHVEDLAQMLGMQLALRPPWTPGLQITSVQADGPAAKRGLAAGDVIVEANGVRLHRLADLVPQDGADTLSISIERAGQVGLVPVTLALDGIGFGAQDFSLTTLALLLAGALLGLSLPLSALRLSRPAPLFVIRERGLGLMRWAPQLFEMMAVMATTTLVVVWNLPWLGVAACVCLALAVAGKAAVGIGWLAPELPKRWALYAALTWVAIVISGTTELDTAIATQASAPWTWNLLRHPAGCPAALAALAILRAPNVGLRSPINWLDTIARTLLALALLAALIGPVLSPGPLRVYALGVGVWLFLIGARGARIHPHVALPLTGVALALAVLVFWFGAAVSVAQVTVPLVLSALCGAWLRAFVDRYRLAVEHGQRRLEADWSL